MHERDLRRALDRHEFAVRFQPVVRASNGRFAGAEALVRWDHPMLGLLGPAAFLPLAERSALLAPIGERVITQAISERATWSAGTFVSVNLSPAELVTAPIRGLVDLIERTCDAHGVAPSDLWVEVTEQPILEPEPTAATLHALRDLGVRLVLDDFGSGHASVARLRDLPFDVCKLDRSFVAGMAGTGGTRVVQAAVAMARAFGTEVVAEGIENAEQLEQLDALGCDLLQGYHLGRPAPADTTRELLTAPGRTDTPRETIRVDVPAGTAAPGDERDHRVLYYDDDRVLAAWVADALAAALLRGDHAVTVTTEEHREMLGAALADRGVDVSAEVASGRLVQYDAAATLDLLMVDGMPATELLAEVVAALTPAGGRELWAYDEMVAVLWERGEVAAAMALEESWNACLAGTSTSLLCSYPSADVAAAGGPAGYERIAQHHSHVTVGGCSLRVDAAAVRRDPTRHVQELRAALAATAVAVGAQARLEAELRELEERVDASGRFGAMVVHEIRNPASILTLALDSLRAEVEALPGDDVGRLLAMATTSVRSIVRLAEDLLLSAQLDATEFAVQPEPFDLGGVVRSAIERTALASGSAITCDLPDPLPAALGDADRVHQILLNLLDNAVASSPPGSSVDVVVAIEADRLVVRVADEGPGIAPAERQRLFEPFTRSETAPKRTSGAGLGLHIVDRLVRAQGGAVWIEEAPSGGAVFAVALPRAVGAGTAAADPFGGDGFALRAS
ncbi:EAL domain-containing protein [Nitriliruptor alkaliphilus]|uniref:EAL domain-containing protein n=1 Tax=Nitriliruptor alkaliphilus TaxID=427918 RepID=UPI000696F826|nr:EAL domain-containing protein [Nitriliruptor alkaliphilus]